MQQNRAEQVIRQHLDKMDELYMGPVFDEAIIVEMGGGAPRMLYYQGPREGEIGRSFSDDVRGLKAALGRPGYGVGDFEFTREGEGEAYDAFLVLGEGLYLICNNTSKSTTQITADASWRKAQRPFVEMGELFRADPLTPE